MIDRMQAHRARDSASSRRRARHIARVADMRAAARLIGAQIIGAEDGAVGLGNEHLLVGAEPVSERVGLVHVAIERIGLARADHRFEDRPDRSGIVLGSGPDDHWNGATIASVTRSGRPLALSSSAHTVRARTWTLPPSPVNSIKR